MAHGKRLTATHMIYIHALKDLNPKSAEIEIVPLVRQLKQTASIPLSEEKISTQFSPFFIAKEDVDLMAKTLEMIPLVIQEITDLAKTNSSNLELVNLKRAVSELQALPAGLKNNIDYLQKILSMQESIIPKLTLLLNTIPTLKTQQDKMLYDKTIGAIFADILRNSDAFALHSADIINESHLARKDAVAEIMSTKAFFKVKMDEYLKKLTFEVISKRIPQEELAKVDAISKKVLEIKSTVEKVYNINMKMIEFAVTFYAYIRWIS